MSISQLVQDNPYKLFLNTSDKGININGTILNSQATNYELILPNDDNLGALSVLIVDSIVDNKVFLKWSLPINPPQSPFNFIECNTLQANVEVISKSLTIDNISGGSTTISYDGNNDITYKLPITAPTNNQVLSSLSNGTMSWVNQIDANTLPSDCFFFELPSTELNQDFPNYLYSQNINSFVSNTYYKIFFSFTSIKVNPTGSFNVEVRPVILGNNFIVYGLMNSGIHPNNVSDVINYGNEIPSEQEYTRNLEYIFKTPASITGTPQFNLQMISDIEAGGILEISQVHVVITPVKRI
jgi:hypothetical protein